MRVTSKGQVTVPRELRDRGFYRDYFSDLRLN